MAVDRSHLMTDFHRRLRFLEPAATQPETADRQLPQPMGKTSNVVANATPIRCPA
jgi:hypothetical protein